jgi:hypothetical protein
LLQNELQRYILKVHSSKIRKANWNLELPLSDARKNDEIISLASSQMLRWIDELNGDSDSEEKARTIRSEIMKLRRQPNSQTTKREIRKLYSALDKTQFKPDYISIIMDRNSDYKRLCKGFKINGISYRRLLGTAGGIKMSTIVFVSDRLYDELNKRVNNGRRMDKAFNPAKLEAYKALTCSASHPVSMPNGIAVVSDCETEFFDTVIHLENAPGDGEPIMSEPVRELIKIDASDGFGLMLPSLAKRWSDELGLDYMVAGVNTRMSFEKGMVFTFDFLDFAENVAGGYIIKDVWGNDVDLRNVEMILTESMLKLWDSYDSCEDYLNKCTENHYTFAVTKTTPKRLENERALNYQFVQSFKLNDDDINKLVSTTKNQIEDVLGGDWRKTLLFLGGSGMSEASVLANDDDCVMRSIMVNSDMMKDPFIQDHVYKQIKGRIKEAKTGVLNVHGNFSIVSGDPYSLCQNMFGLKVTGLLKAGEIYNKYWRDCGSEQVVAFRAPMSCHNNIRKLSVAHRDETDYWYRYMNACSILNSWDTCMPALNGCDFDGDLLMLTDNDVLVRNHRSLPALMCAQNSASKIIPTDEDFMKSNMAGFGNDIGKITNRITSMYELQSYFDEDSIEYKTLDYRIQSGQLQQQDCIDKIKGIVAKPMPKTWYDKHCLRFVEDNVQLYERILAYRKPYFMRYIYQQLSKDYNTYNRRYSRNAAVMFGKPFSEILNADRNELSKEEVEYLEQYEKDLPLGRGDCVINKICYLFEDRFDSVVNRRVESDYDYTIMKSDAEYSEYEFRAIKKLYDEYKIRVQNTRILLQYGNEDSSEYNGKINQIFADFEEECHKVCPNDKSLCNLLIDLLYNTEANKRFMWKVCGKTIVENLMDQFGHKLSFPVINDDGDIEYCGKRFEIITINLED